MAVTVNTTALLATKVGTEHIVAVASAAGVYVFAVAANSMVLGDNVIFRAYDRQPAGSALMPAYAGTYANCQTSLMKYSIPIPVAHSAQFSVEVTSGGASGSGVGSNGPPFDWRLTTIG